MVKDNIHLLPRVVDMIGEAKIGIYTDLYYLFFTLAAIPGPNINDRVVKLSGNNDRYIMLVGPLF